MKKSFHANLWQLAPYLYLAIPVIIFFACWTKFFISIPVILLILYCLYQIAQKNELPQLPIKSKADYHIIIGILVIITIWVYLSGIGRLVFQNEDHIARNSIFEGLVQYNWPMTEQLTIGDSSCMRTLVYYIGFWLPSALIGKVLGLTAGYMFQVVWAVLGIFIFYLLYCSATQKLQVWPLFLFIFFSGLDLFGCYLLGNDLSHAFQDHLETWSYLFEFSSFTTQLFWVFNQAIPVWVALMLIYNQKSNRFIVFIMGLLLISSTLPFIGLIPFVAYWVLTRTYEGATGKMRWKHWFKDTFSIENVLGGGVVGILTFLYLKVNGSGQNSGLSSQSMLNSNFSNDEVSAGLVHVSARGYIFLILLFLFVEAFIYFAVMYRYQWKNPIFYIALITLTLCPFIRIGGSDDFCMRASIPAIVVMWMLVLDTLQQAHLKKDIVIVVLLSICLAVGSITPIFEFNRTISNTVARYRICMTIYQPSAEPDSALYQSNFSGDPTTSFFFKYLARK